MDELLDFLKNIDKSISTEAEKIKTFLESKHYQSNLFNQPNYFDINGDSPIPSQKEISGIYIFYIAKKVSIKNMSEFNDVYHATKIKKKKNQVSVDLDIGDVLYVGKSEDELISRINQHITFSGNEETYSLKLNSPDRIFLLDSYITIYYFELNSQYDEYKKIILPSVECYLHSCLKPKIGSAKTT